MAEQLKHWDTGKFTRGGKNEIRPEDSPHQRALDAWQLEMWERVGLAVGRWLEQRGRLDQPIARLQRHELTGMAWAAVSEWLNVREAKRLELNLPHVVDPAKPDPLDRLLTG